MRSEEIYLVLLLATASTDAFNNVTNAHRFSGNFHKTLTLAAAVAFASVSPLPFTNQPSHERQHSL
jgi:hypothetical protein